MLIIIYVRKALSNLDDSQHKKLSEFYTGGEIFKLMRHNVVNRYEYMDIWKYSHS